MAYTGIFIRDDLDQQPGLPSAGWSESPDVIFNGPRVEPDTSKFTTPAAYGERSSSDVNINVDNYVYLRGKNMGTAGQASHMFFYFTESDYMLWPKNWRSDHIWVAGEARNWSFLEASSANAVAVTQTPLRWVPPPLKGSQYDHYCVIAWSDNSGDQPVPPDLDKWSKFTSCEELAAFLQAHPNMGWRNTHDIYGTPPNYTYSSGLTMKAGGGTVNVGINFIDVPDDGTFNVNLAGTGKTNSISEVGLSVGRNRGGFNVQGLSLPANFSTSLEVEWFKGPTAPPVSAQVQVSLTIDAGPLLVRECNKLGIPTNRIAVELFEANHHLPHQVGMVFKPTPAVLVGRQTWSMHYGVTPPKK
jgi:hypothetical protein